MNEFNNKWYQPGNWSLPQWWTEGPPTRGTGRATHAEQTVFYNSQFAREVLGHRGGMTSPPQVEERS